MNWLDYTFAAILLLSTLFALRKGFVRETIGLISSTVGLVLGFWFYGIPGSVLEPFLSSRRLASFLGFMIIFCGILFLGWLLGWILNRFLKATGLSFLDRLLGGVFGLVRGTAICVAVLTAFIAWSSHTNPATVPRAVVNSQIAPAVTEASRIAVLLAPMELKQRFQEGLAWLQRARMKVMAGNEDR